jgi:hypothetical protein
MGKDIHIDHIIPLSSAKTEEEIYKLCQKSLGCKLKFPFNFFTTGERQDFKKLFPLLVCRQGHHHALPLGPVGQDQLGHGHEENPAPLGLCHRERTSA